ncbi:MAG: DEAD/DEAH box helicase [Candidatus Woesearchaeota archaeon]
MIFEDFNMNDDLQYAIKKMGFEEPTLIQEKSIPPILSGKDVLGESATGSGKTLAFGAGAVENAVPGNGIQALILTPTRELTDQIKDTLLQMIKGSKLKVATVYGGVSIEPQIKELQTADIVVATPGRTKDHLGRGTIDLSNVKTLVLDEADRMLEMGFIEDVEDIIRQCPKKRQGLFFSATFPPKVTHLAQKHLVDPVKIVAKKQVDPSKLSQYYYDVPKNQKFSLLLHLLEEETSKLVMVFCNTRKTVDFVTKNLRSQGIDATAIHGGFTQNKRTNTMDKFKDGKATVLVCTDVAARGIHVDYVSHIYNYEIPKSPTDYVHRIGRTARAGEEGKVINLICDFDYDNFSRVFNEFREYNIQKLEKPYVKIIPIKKTDTDDRRKSHYGRRGPGAGKGVSDRGRGNNRNFRKTSPGSHGPDERPRKSFGNRDSYGPRDDDRRGPRGNRGGSRGSRGGPKGNRGGPRRGSDNRRKSPRNSYRNSK